MEAKPPEPFEQAWERVGSSGSLGAGWRDVRWGVVDQVYCEKGLEVIRGALWSEGPKEEETSKQGIRRYSIGGCGQSGLQVYQKWNRSAESWPGADHRSLNTRPL